MIKGVIRKIQIEEFYKCSNIWDFVKQADLKEIFYQELLTGNRETFIFEKDNQFLGEISIVYDNHDHDYCIPSQRIYVSRVIVKPEYRNQGIGNELIDYVIDYCQKKGYDEMSVGVDKDNIIARQLYEKKGFTKVIYDGADEQGEYVKLLKKLDLNYNKFLLNDRRIK